MAFPNLVGSSMNVPPPPITHIGEKVARQSAMTLDDLTRIQKEPKVPAFEKKNFAGLPIDVALTTEGKPGRSAHDPNQDSFIFDEGLALIGVTDGVSQSKEAALAARELAAVFPDAVKLLKVEARDGRLEELKKDLIANNKQRGVKISDMARSIAIAESIDEKLVRKAWLLWKAAQEINPAICKTKGMAAAVFTFLHQVDDGSLFAISMSLGDCEVMDASGQINQEDSLFDQAVSKGWIDVKKYADPATGRISPDAMIDVTVGGRVVMQDTYRALRNKMSACFGNPKESPVPDITFHEIKGEFALFSDGVGDRVETPDGTPDAKKIFGLGAGKSLKAWGNAVRTEALNAKGAYKDPDDTTGVFVRRHASLSV